MLHESRAHRSARDTTPQTAVLPARHGSRSLSHAGHDGQSGSHTERHGPRPPPAALGASPPRARVQRSPAGRGRVARGRVEARECPYPSFEAVRSLRPQRPASAISRRISLLGRFSALLQLHDTHKLGLASSHPPSPTAGRCVLGQLACTPASMHALEWASLLRTRGAPRSWAPSTGTGKRHRRSTGRCPLPPPLPGTSVRATPCARRVLCAHAKAICAHVLIACEASMRPRGASRGWRGCQTDHVAARVSAVVSETARHLDAPRRPLISLRGPRLPPLRPSMRAAAR